MLISAGAVCPNSGNVPPTPPVPQPPPTQCILGSGGGLAIRFGWRTSEGIYLGGAYELSKQDPNKLFRLAILQQLRGEIRKYFPTGHDVQPLLAGAVGVAGYGNEWAIATWGPTAFLGGGLELDVAGGNTVGLLFGYRPMYLQAFSDPIGKHDAGLAQFFGLELTLETRDPIQ
jgi:hypothetical protein